jgi:UDP-N-acetylmuramate dehydrogenase
MMPGIKSNRSLIDRLPETRGRLSENADLSRITWFRVGGAAEVMFRPADLDDLVGFLAAKPADVPVTVIGVGSNIIVRDGGIGGVVIRLGRGFANIGISGSEITAGASAMDVNVAMACRNSGVAGLEFLCGIPGTIGAALCMNAGAYGAEMKDVTVSATAVDPGGGVHELALAELGFAYRHSAVPEDWIFTGAVLRGEAGEAGDIARRMNDIKQARSESQPVRMRTGGSTFVNPSVPEAMGRKAWQLVEAAGCRGLRIGGAMVSEQHCNFLINTGDATAADIEALGEEVRRRVYQATGVRLEWEIRRIGRPAPAAGLEEVAP